MNIKVLGSGCSNCKRLEVNTKKALKQLGIDVPVIEIKEYAVIMKYGIMSTPALVIDEKVLFTGKVPSVNELAEIISKVKK
ncbi:MAG: redox-active disulfide protein 2 [Bdellovibrionales bacterium GWA2_49_15]|nr:MAG: redox-active disulfide protein 2 [Bdellovibrionales bacterium GWA2_49_15]HAZ14714.1 redox-active disulfide protein 2 [Bdellovibrionales bacterium]